MGLRSAGTPGPLGHSLKVRVFYHDKCFDGASSAALFSRFYGATEAVRWIVRWRIFFMACSELWGYGGGEEWLVSHYLFEMQRGGGPVEMRELAPAGSECD